MPLNFLLEIGTEELPAAYLKPYSQQLQKLFQNAIAKLNLTAIECSTVYTPRRLTLFCAGLSESQPKLEQEIKGPPAAIAFKNGQPTKAAEAFARKTGLKIDQIESKDFDGREYLFAQVTTGGSATKDLLPELINNLLVSLKSPKSMHWEDKPTTFARPIRWLVALLDQDLISVDLDGLKSDRITYGHRFIAPEAISLATADKEDYLAKLAGAFVVPNIEDRIAILTKKLIAKGGSKDKLDADLVNTCANLVEWPEVVRGNFSPEYLELPEEVLVSSLKKHQKSFLVYDAQGHISAGFLSVANNDLDNPDLIRNGYERVIIARLADAKFFWDEDRKKSLAERVEALKKVIFQQELGSYYAKAERVIAIIKALAEKTNQGNYIKVASRAALLARTDLLTAMVYEFPELQGTMGSIYAKQVDGEDDAIVKSISEMYLPKSANDDLPTTCPGAMLSISDKIDTIVGCCSVGFGPTGSADPYALRRQAIGVIKIIINQGFDFSLMELVNSAVKLLKVDDKKALTAQVAKLFKGRFETILKDCGVRYDIVNATLSKNWDKLARNATKAQRLMELVDQDDFKETCQVVERCKNITKKIEVTQLDVDPGLFCEEAEKATWQIWLDLQNPLSELLKLNDFKAAVALLADLLAPKLNQYFADVLVNVEDEKVRMNRYKMLRSISEQIKEKLADLSKVVVA